MDLKNLIAEEATVAIEFGDDILNVTYRANALSFAEVAEFQKTTDPDEIADFLLRFVVAWDLVDDGEPVPVTHESMMGLPIFALGKIMAGMASAGRVGEANGAT